MGFLRLLVTLLFNRWTLALAAIAIVFKLWYKVSVGICTSTRRLEGLTALVTGANSGIGLETAKDLARRGARVLLACRDPQRGRKALEEVREVASEAASVELLPLDLLSLDSVRACAAQVLASEPRLDILVNNAGAAGLGPKQSRNGLHRTLQVNLFSPFLLTMLLVPLLKKSAPSRVVFVTSMIHRFTTLKPELLDHERAKHLNDFQIFKISLLAKIVVANEFARRLKNTGVTVNSLHPGLVLTNLYRRLPRIATRVAKVLMRIFVKTPIEGAQTSIYLSASEEVEGVTGRYFSDCKEARMAMQAYDESLARAVWEKCEQLVELRDEERSSFH